MLFETCHLPLSVLSVLLLCLGAAQARADMWTNAAGHRLEAKLVDGTESAAVFERADGSTLRMPMASLKPEDQARAKALLCRTGVLPPSR